MCGLLAFAVAGAAVLGRFIEITNPVVLLAAVFSPYLTLGASVSAAAVFLALRRWILAVVVAVFTVAALVIAEPADAAAAGTNGDAVPVRVMTANLFEGRADSRSLFNWARDNADVVALQEITVDEMSRLTAAGIDTEFPHRAVVPKRGSRGAALWSRYPIERITNADPSRPAAITARIEIPGVSIPTTFVVVHTTAPWPWPISEWRDAMGSLRHTLELTEQSADNGAVVVAGDFNSTRDMLQFRHLLSAGYHDAAEQAGADFAPTYPANSWLPPMLAIDHVLIQGATASSAYTATIPGSDHRALITTVHILRRASD